jgi:hypothetical protein
MMMKTVGELWEDIPKTVEILEVNAYENMNPEYSRNKIKRKYLKWHRLRCTPQNENIIYYLFFAQNVRSERI